MTHIITRRHLRDRAKPLSSDVADAIEMLVQQQSNGLPMAMTRTNVLDQLIVIANTNEEGLYIRPNMANASTMKESWGNLLANNYLFQSGYKDYEKRSGNPVVPVTDFFFKVVFTEESGDQLDQTLDGMNQDSIKASLPKRRSAVQVNDEDGETRFVESGLVAGILVFPAGSSAAIQRAWLGRLKVAAIGVMNRAVDSITHARPATQAVQDLREAAGTMPSAMQKALPRPKATPQNNRRR